MLIALLQARHLVWLWATASGFTAYVLTLPDSPSAVSNAFSTHVGVAALVGLGVASLFSPLLTASWMRWYWGALTAIPIGMAIVFVFFFFQPHAWQPSRLDAWKSVALFIEVYPHVILPMCVGTGALSTRFIREAPTVTG